MVFLEMAFLSRFIMKPLAVELSRLDIPYVRERSLSVIYKGEALPCLFRADLICYDTILVELKAQMRLSGTEDAQIVNYLKASGLKKGLLLNFGASRLDYKRFVF
jgi:GxxExxY protein